MLGDWDAIVDTEKADGSLSATKIGARVPIALCSAVMAGQAAGGTGGSSEDVGREEVLRVCTRLWGARSSRTNQDDLLSSSRQKSWRRGKEVSGGRQSPIIINAEKKRDVDAAAAGKNFDYGHVESKDNTTRSRVALAEDDRQKRLSAGGDSGAPVSSQDPGNQPNHSTGRGDGDVAVEAYGAIQVVRSVTRKRPAPPAAGLAVITKMVGSHVRNAIKSAQGEGKADSATMSAFVWHIGHSGSAEVLRDILGHLREHELLEYARVVLVQDEGFPGAELQGGAFLAAIEAVRDELGVSSSTTMSASQCGRTQREDSPHSNRSWHSI